MDLQKHDMMKQAILNKRGKHLEIKISVEPKDAPEGDAVPEEPVMEASAPEAKIPPAPQEQEMSEDEYLEPIMANYSDSDKDSLMKRAPKSIREAAMSAHLKKKNKGA